MSFILRNSVTGEIAACIQKNNYGLDYYGVKQWSTEVAALAEQYGFLTELGRDDAHCWMVMHLDEHRIKIGNVKLKNDSGRVLQMSLDGVLTTMLQEKGKSL